ncbi:hypothetical protein LX36DRAFT_660628 [Colletotrichum falcatum]|nr:hypothetical protein LX36DRAFT_660628 [Colletotrichum falcatum]
MPRVFFITAAPSLSPPLVRFSFHACCLARTESIGMRRKQRHEVCVDPSQPRKALSSGACSPNYHGCLLRL